MSEEQNNNEKHEENHQVHKRTNASKKIFEPDEQMPLKIRPIELIKHNPNMFHIEVSDMPKIYEILGGHEWLGSTVFGGILGWFYYSRKPNQGTFYMRLNRLYTRIILGAFIGAWIGYMKFGDRQRLHNAWVAERLRRRYPESMNLD